jgi:hypothetical protein
MELIEVGWPCCSGYLVVCLTVPEFRALAGMEVIPGAPDRGSAGTVSYEGVPGSGRGCAPIRISPLSPANETS